MFWIYNGFKERKTISELNMYFVHVENNQIMRY